MKPPRNFYTRPKSWLENTPHLRATLPIWQNCYLQTPNKELPLGKDTYKIRLAIGSKGKGKSGGARVITCVKIISAVVYLVSIYDKSEQSGIPDRELRERIKNLPLL